MPMPSEHLSAEISYWDCYRRLRADGLGRLKSMWYSWDLYKFAQQSDVARLSDPEKWRVT